MSARTEPCWDCNGETNHLKQNRDGDVYVVPCATCDSTGRLTVNTADSGLSDSYDPWENY